MAGNRRNRKRRPARQILQRSPKRRLLVVCEGKVTEPAYLRGFERCVRNALVEIEIPDEQGVPLTLVRKAIEQKLRAEQEARRFGDTFLLYDEVWCVFDIDEHPKLNDAFQLAAAQGVALAVSNPCFELWLLLHFRESPGARHRHDVQGMLRKFIPGYDKHLDFGLVVRGVSDATERARRLYREAEDVGEAGRNPTTGVFELTNSIARTDNDS